MNCNGCGANSWTAGTCDYCGGTRQWQRSPGRTLPSSTLNIGSAEARLLAQQAAMQNVGMHNRAHALNQFAQADAAYGTHTLAKHGVTASSFPLTLPGLSITGLSSILGNLIS